MCPAPGLRAYVQLRTRVMYGSRAGVTAGYARSLNSDIGLVDVSRNIGNGCWYVLDSAIDRIWWRYSI